MQVDEFVTKLQGKATFCSVWICINDKKHKGERFCTREGSIPKYVWLDHSPNVVSRYTDVSGDGFVYNREWKHDKERHFWVLATAWINVDILKYG